MTDFDTLLSRIVQLLDREKIPYMLTGGYAVLLWGEPRTTRDLDLTVQVSDEALAQFLDTIAEIGKPVLENPVDFATKRRVLPISSQDAVPIDFILATLPFEFSAIQRAIKVRIGEALVSVCSPEDLIVQKALSERERDHEDIVGIMRKQGTSLDLARLEAQVNGLSQDLAEPAIAERFQRAKREAGLAIQ